MCTTDATFLYIHSQMMDWQALSRSRSRAEGMDWRSDSRSRSGPTHHLGPGNSTSNHQWIHGNESHSHGLLQEDSKPLLGTNDVFGFTGFGPDGSSTTRSRGSVSNQKLSVPIPIPGASSSSSGSGQGPNVFKSPADRGRSILHKNDDGNVAPEPAALAAAAALMHGQHHGHVAGGGGRRKHASESGPSDFLDMSNLAGGSQSSSSHLAQHQRQHQHDHPPLSLSGFNAGGFHPSSLPAAGLHGFAANMTEHANVSPPGPWGQEKKHMFPKHVRKTSFDHTVSRSGIMGDAGGRHQVNGRPIGPDTSLVSWHYVLCLKYGSLTPHRTG